MLPAAASLAALVLLFQIVSPREIPALLDTRLLSLFVVLILAVECARLSRSFDVLVDLVLRRFRSERDLAAGAVLLPRWRPFWGLFSAVSGALLAASVAWSLILLGATP